MVTKGDEGEMPDWFPIAFAAKFWGVAPYALLRESRYWIDVAAEYAKAEQHVQDVQHKAQARAARIAKRK